MKQDACHPVSLLSLRESEIYCSVQCHFASAAAVKSEATNQPSRFGKQDREPLIRRLSSLSPRVVRPAEASLGTPSLQLLARLCTRQLVQRLVCVRAAGSHLEVSGLFRKKLRFSVILLPFSNDYNILSNRRDDFPWPASPKWNTCLVHSKGVQIPHVIFF